MCFVRESISSNCCDVLEGLSGLGVKDLSVCFVCESISTICCDVVEVCSCCGTPGTAITQGV